MGTERMGWGLLLEGGTSKQIRNHPHSSDAHVYTEAHITQSMGPSCFNQVFEIP